MRFFWQKPKPAHEAPKLEIEVLVEQIVSKFDSEPVTREFQAGMLRGDPSSYFKMGEYLAAKDPNPFGEASVFFLCGASLGSVPCVWKVMNVNIKLLNGKRISSFEDYFQETIKQVSALPSSIDFAAVMTDSPLLRYYQHVNALAILLAPDSMRKLGKSLGGERRFNKRSTELYFLIQADGIGRRSGQAAALFGLLMEMPPDHRENLVKAHLWYEIAIANGFALVEADLTRVERKMNLVEIAEAKSLFEGVNAAWNDHGSKPRALSIPLKPLAEIAGVSQLAFVSSS